MGQMNEHINHCRRKKMPVAATADDIITRYVERRFPNLPTYAERVASAFKAIVGCGPDKLSYETGKSTMPNWQRRSIALFPTLGRARLERSLRERLQCSSLIDWPVHPRLRRTMRDWSRSRKPGGRDTAPDFRPSITSPSVNNSGSDKRHGVSDHGGGDDHLSLSQHHTQGI
jgi:hypothetical protein